MSERFQLSKHGDFGAGEYAFIISAPDAPAVGMALAENGPFPDPPIDILEVELRGEAGGEFLSLGSGDATARVKLGVGGKILLRSDGEELPEALGVPEGTPFLEGLDGSPPPGARFLVLERNYVLGAEANGAVALSGSPVRFRFGLDGSVEGRMLVVRAFEPGDPSREVFQSTVDSWRSPKTVGPPGTDSELPPGTWLLVETAGGVEFQAEAQYGLDFTWIKESPLGALEGDIGMRLNARIGAALQIQASGQFWVVVSRPGDTPDIRVQVHRHRTRGWGFNVDTRVGFAPTAPSLPEKPEELLRAILGTHSQQLLRDLTVLKDWSISDADTVELLAGFTVGQARDLLEGIFGPEYRDRMEEARDRVLDVVDRVRSADDRVVSFLVAELENRTEAVEEKVEEFLVPLRNGLEILQDPVRVRGYLEEHLRKVSFLSTPIGSWLIEVAGDHIGAALMDDRLDGIVDRAQETLDILDVPDLDDLPLLPRLLEEVRRPFQKLDELAETAEEVLSFDMDSLSGWAQAKVESLVRDTPADEALEELRTALRGFFGQADGLYAAARKALARDYELRFARSVQEERWNDALLDVTFRFGEGDRDTLTDLLSKTIRGNFGGVLFGEHPGVELNRSALTLGFSRRGSVEVVLPFIKEKQTRAVDAVANFRSSREGDGRVYVMEAEAKSVVTSAARYSSSLSLAVTLDLGARVHQFKSDRFEIRWASRHALNDLHEKELVEILRPWSQTLLPGVFGKPGQGSLEDWVSDLDNLVDLAEPENGARRFGDTLLELSAAVPASVCAAWFDAPARGRDPTYQWLGHQLQASVKNLFTTFFFADPSRYTRDQVISAAFLVFQSAPSHLNKDNEHWFTSFPFLEDPRHPVLASAALRRHLATNLERVHGIVAQLPEHSQRARHFHPSKVNSVLEDARSHMGQSLLARLFRLEKTVVNGARDAGVELGKARAALSKARTTAKKEKAVKKALERLQEFELTVVDTFHQEVEIPFAAGMARPLGAILFTEAARVFGADDRPPFGMLNLIVVRNDGAFPLGGYLEGRMPASDDIVVRQLLSSERQ